MPPATPTLDAAETRLVARVEAALDSLDALRPFSGIVVVRHRARTLLVRTRGVANRQTGAAIDLGTAFNLGSSNKLFTAIAVRRLVAEGRLAADAPIARYWPDYPDPPFARVATVEQLLAHRSGIGGDIFGRPPGGRLSLRRNDDFVPLFAGVAPEFAAGTQQAYSNPGFVVLGGLIERVAGVSYYRYLDSVLFAPVGMTHTASYALDSLPPFAALGYTTQGAGGATPQVNTAFLPGRGSAAGGGYASAGDLVRFLDAVRAGRVVGLPEGAFSQGGGGPGVNAWLSFDAPPGFDCIVLANVDPPAALAVFNRLQALLR